jgi:hypothetical protein
VTRLRQSPEVAARRLGDETVLVHLGTNAVFTLNETGGRIWELVGEGLDLDAVAERLAVEFEVDPGRLRAELDRLVSELSRAGLLEPSV